MKIAVILGNPSEKTLCSSIADAYAEGAREAGAEVEVIKLGNLKFDPILHEGYHQIQKLEPDLKKAQKILNKCDHMVWVYPNWWSTMPALMKGFIDRTILPGTGFRFKEDSPLWEKLWKGKTARLMITMNTPKLVYKMMMGNAGINQMKKGILGFCGVKTKVSIFSPAEKASDKKIAGWLEKARETGKKLE